MILQLSRHLWLKMDIITFNYEINEFTRNDEWLGYDDLNEQKHVFTQIKKDNTNILKRGEANKIYIELIFLYDKHYIEYKRNVTTLDQYLGSLAGLRDLCHELILFFLSGYFAFNSQIVKMASIFTI